MAFIGMHCLVGGIAFHRVSSIIGIVVWSPMEGQSVAVIGCSLNKAFLIVGAVSIHGCGLNTGVPSHLQVSSHNGVQSLDIWSLMWVLSLC